MLLSLLLTLAADPIKLQSLSTNTNHIARPAPPAAPTVAQRTPVYILPEVWAVQTSPGVIYLRIPDHNFQDLVRLFPATTIRLTNVTVYSEK